MPKKIGAWLLLLSLILECLLLGACQKKPNTEKYSSYSFDYFDTVTSITGYTESQEEFDRISDAILSELERYHKLFNIYYPYEGMNNLYTINQVIDGAHATVRVEKEIMDMLLYAKEMYTLTGGQVNVAMGSVLSIWHEYRESGLRDPQNAKIPPAEDLIAAAAHTDIENVILDTVENTVFLSDPAMRLDVGAIAKGYAVEQVALRLESLGISGFVLNVGGNVRTVGARGDGERWTVGIENPLDTEGDYVALLSLADLSLVTSGSYQRFYTVGDLRLHHIIDPDTLMPATGFASVSIVTKSSALADALSTALFSMSYADGLALIESIPEAEAMWCFENGEILYSSGFEAYRKQ